MRGGAARWVVFGVLTLMLAALVTGALALLAGAPPEALSRIFALSIFYGICIGFPSMWVLPAVGRRVAQGPRLRGLLTTLAVGAALTGGAMLVATATLAGLGVIPPAQLWQRLLTDGGFSVLLSLPLSTGAFGWSRMVGRLQTSEAAQREAERRRERAERLEFEARFSSLAARLQPYFLFNTLNSVAALVREDPAAAERLVEQLASLLRASLDAGGGRPVTLQRELDLVQDYLEIETVRLGARLRCSVHAEPGTEALAVPPFALQTLVENAVKYAVAPRREGGRVQVAVRREGERLLLEVSDDGPGFGGPAPAGHGLDMLAQRLDALFADAAGLRIERGATGGACVRVHLPAEAAA
jgi:signal transduction histidine kinase